MCVYLVAYESVPAEREREKRALLERFGASGVICLYPGLCLVVSGPHAPRVKQEILEVLGPCRCFVTLVGDDYDFQQSAPGRSSADTPLEGLLPTRKWDAG